MRSFVKINGFTLIEILLSVAIISIMFVFSSPLLNSFHWNSELAVVANETSQSLRRAATLARSGQNDAEWGIRIDTGTLTLFRGSSYATRDSSYDELFNYATSISPSGLSEVVFSKLTGLPTSTGSIVFTSPQGQSRTIIVNSEGGVSY